MLSKDIRPNNNVLHCMRAPYPAALAIKRFTYRLWAVDVVTYMRGEWITYVWGLNVDGKRLGPSSTVVEGLTKAQRFIDESIEKALKDPPEKPAKKHRGTKRPKRKTKEVV